MNVKLLDLTRQYEYLKDEILPVVEDIFETQRFVNGPVVQEFERNFAEYCGTKFAVGCSSGTDALIMSLIALDIGPGDEVITVPFTFFATVEAIIRRGATPVFVDICEKTFNIDVSRVEDAITDKTKAIIPVHLFGQCANMDAILDIANRYDLDIIEDAAQAVGATWNSRRAGSMGTLGCFSFFPAKNLGGFGDGGMVTTNDEALYSKMLRTRQHGIDMSNPYHYDHIGGNFRLDALQAGILNVKLKYIDEWSERRANNASYYNEHFNEFSDIVTPHNLAECRHVYNQYVIRVKDRDSVRQLLTERGIGCAVYYPYPIHTQPCVSNLGYAQGDFPVTEKVCKEVLALPIYPDLKQEELSYITKELASL